MEYPLSWALQYGRDAHAASRTNGDQATFAAALLKELGEPGRAISQRDNSFKRKRALNPLNA